MLLELFKIISQNTQYQKSYLWREFQPETYHIKPKHGFGTRTKIRLEILIRSTISTKHKFGEHSSEGLQNVSETLPCAMQTKGWSFASPGVCVLGSVEVTAPPENGFKVSMKWHISEMVVLSRVLLRAKNKVNRSIS